MKIHFEKLGVINRGDLNLNGLTLLCGPNNTGKTYAMYCLYALLDEKFEVRFPFVQEIVKNLLESKVCQYDLNILLDDHFEDILNHVAQGLQKRLPSLFGVEPSEFKQTKLKLSVERDQILKNAIHHHWQMRLRLGTQDSDWILDIEKPKQSNQITLTLQDKGVPSRVLVEFISSNITRLIFSQTARSCLLLPSERAGLNLFFKELSSIRNRLLHHAQKDNINPMEVLKDIVQSRYAEPVSDYIEFLNNLTTIKKQKGKYREQAQIVHRKILNGKYDIDRYGEIFFLPYRSHSKKLPLHFTSSTVKTLFGLVFYLEHSAQSGDCLMIDEPELNLHPDNQRNLARLLAQLVKNGIKVVVSTHSTYLVRELNNLIMLHKPFSQAEALRKRYGYEADDSLDPDLVSAYLFDQKSIKAMDIDAEGVIAETFDEVVNTLNQSSNEIYYSSQEEEQGAE